MVVDRPAAARFIKNAFASNGGADANDIGMQTRFNILKHQEAQLRAPSSAASSSSGSDSESEGGSVVPPAPKSRSRAKNAKGKGRASEEDSDVIIVDAGEVEARATGSGTPVGGGDKKQDGGKNKRPKMDPFAGTFLVLSRRYNPLALPPPPLLPLSLALNTALATDQPSGLLHKPQASNPRRPKRARPPRANGPRSRKRSFPSPLTLPITPSLLRIFMTCTCTRSFFKVGKESRDFI